MARYAVHSAKSTVTLHETVAGALIAYLNTPTANRLTEAGTSWTIREINAVAKNLLRAKSIIETPRDDNSGTFIYSYNV